ncbi:hypothetical protein BC943DRAFT_275173 [Umbelopsis sp. AD052]|nr:hypothetical protein BC943DRAFT_275173 [Umbelopsis sp. AD052]
MVVNWGIIGTGNIANAFASALKHAKEAQLVAVGSRSKQSAVKFGTTYGIPEEHCHPTYDDLFSDPKVHAVYICTPHPYHCELALMGAKAGKHLLVEKPMAMNEKEAVQIIDAAKDNNVFFMEGYMYRCHPQTKKLCEIISQGLIGDVKLIRANFSYNGTSYGPESRVWNNELGGGALLDIGGYPLSLARLVAGAARGLPFSNPDSLQAIGKLSSTNVDEWTIASLNFSNNEIGAQLFTGIFADSDCTAEVIGSAGTIRLTSPWRPDVPEMGKPTIVLTKPGEAPTTIEDYESLGTSIFIFEAEEVSNAILAGQKECRFMTWEDSIGQVKAMDEWRRQIGLKYNAD